MNYKKHYDALMSRAKERKLTGYVEKHHILPRCIGGTNARDNIARLTPEEHYVAHQLLVKMYPGNTKLLWAASNMTGRGKNLQRNNKLYGWLRRRLSERLTGRVHSAAILAKVAASRKTSTKKQGRPVGYTHSEETKQKMAQALQGKAKSFAHREALAQAKLGKKRGPQSVHQRTRQQAVMDTPLYKQHIAEAALEYWSAPGKTAEQSTRMREWWAWRKAANALASPTQEAAGG